MKIDGGKPLSLWILVQKPRLDFKRNKEKAEEVDDDKDLSAELAKSADIGEKWPDIPPWSSISEGWLVNKEDCDETKVLD